MPGERIDLLRRLRERVGLPVIVVTGMATSACGRGNEGGAADFLEKPFDDEVLLGAVRAALRAAATDGARSAQRTRSVSDWRRCQAASAQVLKGLVRATRTRPSPMISASARERSRSIGPMS